jgi:hypothetical protein
VIVPLITAHLRIRLAPPGQAGSLDLAVPGRLLIATQAEQGVGHTYSSVGWLPGVAVASR